MTHDDIIERAKTAFSEKYPDLDKEIASGQSSYKVYWARSVFIFAFLEGFISGLEKAGVKP